MYKRQAIDCLAIEDEYGNTPAQRAELDWLLYNKPLECVQLVLSGEIEPVSYTQLDLAYRYSHNTTSFEERLKAKVCEVCGCTDSDSYERCV